MRTLTILTLVTVGWLSGFTQAGAHCEIPCGIYGDDARFTAIFEDLTTIEKSMNQINTLSSDPGTNANQLVRWVNNKETHADRIRDVVAQYFLAQRVKAPAEGDAEAAQAYHRKLTLLHQMIQAAMKCKQTVDVVNVKKLHDAAHAFLELYQK
tara:strand:+ start:8563 stop:9021 length:459 start_codon:yes stop_codon:yes gene_type:complete